MLKTVSTILLLFPFIVSAQTDSLAWLRTTIEQAVSKEVSLVKPCGFFLRESEYLLEGITISQAEYSKRLDELGNRETEEKKEEQRTQYGDVFSTGSSYAGLPHEIINMFRGEAFGWHKEKNHDRSAIVVLSDGINYVVNIYNFEKLKKPAKPQG